MILALDESCQVATAEEMALSTVPSIVRVRVEPVQRAHSASEGLCGDLHNEVVVVRKEAVREALPVEPCDDPGEEREEEGVVVVVQEDRPAAVSSRCDVVVAAGDLVARLPWHRLNVALPLQRTCCATVKEGSDRKV